MPDDSRDLPLSERNATRPTGNQCPLARRESDKRVFIASGKGQCLGFVDNATG